MITFQVTQLSIMLNALITREGYDYDTIEAFFIQALTWSLGAGLLEQGRIVFDKQLKYLASLPTQDSETELAVAGNIYLCVFRNSIFPIGK